MLVHECAHLVRRDPWVNLLQRVAAVMFLIHPGVHWLNRQIERAREEICDNYALLHADRADYSQMLLELAERAVRHPKLPALGILGSRWTLENRIAGLLDPHRSIATRTKRRNVLAVVLLLADDCDGRRSRRIPGDRPSQQTATANRTVEVRPQTSTPASNRSESPRDGPAATNPTSTSAAPATRKITIYGICHDSQRKPVANVHVRVFRYAWDIDHPVLLAETKSDGDGHYRLRDIESSVASADSSAGRPVVVATANGTSR